MELLTTPSGWSYLSMWSVPQVKKVNFDTRTMIITNTAAHVVSFTIGFYYLKMYQVRFTVFASPEWTCNSTNLVSHYVMHMDHAVVSGVLSRPTSVNLTSYNMNLVLRWDPPEGVNSSLVYTTEYRWVYSAYSPKLKCIQFTVKPSLHTFNNVEPHNSKSFRLCHLDIPLFFHKDAAATDQLHAVLHMNRLCLRHHSCCFISLKCSYQITNKQNFVNLHWPC